MQWVANQKETIWKYERGDSLWNHGPSPMEHGTAGRQVYFMACRQTVVQWLGRGFKAEFYYSTGGVLPLGINWLSFIVLCGGALDEPTNDRLCCHYLARLCVDLRYKFILFVRRKTQLLDINTVHSFIAKARNLSLSCCDSLELCKTSNTTVRWIERTVFELRGNGRTRKNEWNGNHIEWNPGHSTGFLRCRWTFPSSPSYMTRHVHHQAAERRILQSRSHIG